MKNLDTLSSVLARVHGKSEWKKVLQDLLTESEIETISERIQIVEGLKNGQSQREIARALSVSLFRVTHAARVLKRSVGGFALLLKGKSL